MRVTITFPDGSKYTYSVDVKGVGSIEEIAERLLNDMSRHARNYFKDIDAWKKGVRRWLIPYLYSSILEALHKRRETID
ncbi:hypothetical protein KEJ27_09870 [Candidatus Bathyarchaeota archaeon]|nr:hypothetical protein [Candidatus Bathyarchaeota archaeon]